MEGNATTNGVIGVEVPLIPRAEQIKRRTFEVMKEQHKRIVVMKGSNTDNNRIGESKSNGVVVVKKPYSEELILPEVHYIDPNAPNYHIYLDSLYECDPKKRELYEIPRGVHYNTPAEKKPIHPVEAIEDDQVELYVDNFPCTVESLSRHHPKNVLDTVTWDRPLKSITQHYAIINENKQYNSGDVLQGDLEDCWFLGSLALVADRRDLIKKLFLPCTTPGMYKFQFYYYGEWRQVIIDDQIPMRKVKKKFPTPQTTNNSQQPPQTTEGNTDNTQTQPTEGELETIKKILYGQNRDSSKTWVSLVEKAYAKMHYGYQGINLGHMADGFVDLTGGTSEVLDFFFDSEWKADVDSNSGLKIFTKLFTALHYENFLVGAGITPHPQNKEKLEDPRKYGLLLAHAYSVLSVQKIEGIQLICLRNPWGNTEFRGDWSDKSELWQKHERIRKEVKLEVRNDGVFWMEWKDFIKFFNTIVICRLYEDEYGVKRAKYVIKDEWSLVKDNCGGCRSANNPKWINNDQWIFELEHHVESGKHSFAEEEELRADQIEDVKDFYKNKAGDIVVGSLENFERRKHRHKKSKEEQESKNQTYNNTSKVYVSLLQVDDKRDLLSDGPPHRNTIGLEVWEVHKHNTKKVSPTNQAPNVGRTKMFKDCRETGFEVVMHPNKRYVFMPCTFDVSTVGKYILTLHSEKNLTGWKIGENNNSNTSSSSSTVAPGSSTTDPSVVEVNRVRLGIELRPKTEIKSLPQPLNVSFDSLNHFQKRHNN